jgi:hypothetical protein
MNAPDYRQQAYSWQGRLQQGSRYLQTIFAISAITFATISVLGFVFTIANVRPPISFDSNCFAMADALECWFAYKLFSHYTRGEWFGPATVRWMQAIGILSVVRGCGNIWINVSVRLHHEAFYHIQNSPLLLQAVVYLQFIFSQLLHNLVFGCVILFIAWVLDEGRKIQKEQELTV